MYRATLENGAVIEAQSFGDMLAKTAERGQRIRDYDIVGRKAKKSSGKATK